MNPEGLSLPCTTPVARMHPDGCCAATPAAQPFRQRGGTQPRFTRMMRPLGGSEGRGNVQNHHMSHSAAIGLAPSRQRHNIGGCTAAAQASCQAELVLATQHKAGPPGVTWRADQPLALQSSSQPSSPSRRSPALLLQGGDEQVP